jgi:hypothetical protein
MTYVPNLHWSGTDKIEMYVEDETGVQSNVSTIKMFVSDINDAAIVKLPMLDGIPMLNAVEDEATLITGVKIIDVDLGPYSTLELSIRPGNGTVTFSSTKGIKYSKGKNVFHGQLDALNRALRGIMYKGNNDFVGYDTIEFSVSEPGAQAKTTAVTLWVNLQAVNDMPIVKSKNVSAIITRSPYELINVFTISDVDNTFVEVNITSSVGSIDIINAASIYLDTKNTGYHGEIEDLNKAFQSLNLNVPMGYSGKVSIVLSVFDGEFTVTESLQVDVAMPETGPAFNILNSITLYEDSSSIIKHIHVVDDISETIDFTIFSSNGRIYHGEDAESVRKLNSSTIRGLPTDLNRVLKDAQYSPNKNFVGFDFITIYAKYSSRSVISMQTIEVQVKNKNDALKHPI